MRKGLGVVAVGILVLVAAVFPCRADSLATYQQKLAAVALGEFDGVTAMVQYLDTPSRARPSFEASAADTSLAAHYGSAFASAVSTFTVTSAGDGNDPVPGDGICGHTTFPRVPCTFRAALEEANAHAGFDVINFSIGTGVKTITPASPLPIITEPVIIDGTTQPGFAGTPIIELNGANAGAAADGLQITAGSSTVSGLVINRFAGNGIELTTFAGGNDISRNFIGTDATGMVDLGNLNGVYINSSPNNTIGGTTTAARNVISGNNSAGIDITGPLGGNQVLGNFIGTDATGTVDLANSYGVFIIDASSNTIGGTTSAGRNVISGNLYGVLISDATGNQVLGNFIGTDLTGTAGLGNAYGVEIRNPFSDGNAVGGSVPGAGNVISGNRVDGINITGYSHNTRVLGNFIGTDVNGTAALRNGWGVNIDSSVINHIGGTAGGERNVISGNFGGILINDESNTNWVLGNFIGTDVNGTAALGNSWDGVRIFSGNNTIGGMTPGARNVISGNKLSGILIAGSRNKVLGNFIGTDVTGTFDLGNSLDGVSISYSSNNTIGGTTAAAQNVILGNDRDGVQISGNGAENEIFHNSIFSNSSLGIELYPISVTLNDSGDGDAGANNLQNFPVLSQAFSQATTTIVGRLNSYANAPFTLEFFSNDSCDTSGYGEGQTYIGSDTVTTDGNGKANINVTFAIAILTGKFITATATDSAGNTSEFCQCQAVCAAAKGDMNASGGLSPADLVLMLNCVFLASGNCDLCFADMNCSGGLSPADVVIELNMVFLGAAPGC